MNSELDEKTKRELERRISRIENGERPEAMSRADWLMPIGVCALITVLLVASL